MGSSATYEPIPTIEVNDDEEEQEVSEGGHNLDPVKNVLTLKEKWRLVRPLLWTYMLPLCKLLPTLLCRVS